MKLLGIIMFGFCMSVHASLFSQQTRVSLDMHHAPLDEVLQEMSKQTNLNFLYNYDMIKGKGKVDIKANNEEFLKILEELLPALGLEYAYDNQVVVIRESRAGQAPQQVLKGKVVDEKNNPLPGVTILIRGTSSGVATDKEGRFSITFTGEAVTLLFSFIGMETQEIRIGELKPGESREDLVVVMKESKVELDQVIVTGIYTRKKESFSGSSNTYTGTELKTIGNQNVLQSLKTLDPSFAILENNLFGSDPNRLPDINVRGKTSVIGLTQEYGTDPNQPLFILDGFETTLATISDLSMDRVENITVLKDAAATAIYGSKAANGVIVVETKAPKAGTLRLNYNGNLNLSFADLSDYNLMNSSEKLEFEKLSGLYGKVDHYGNLQEEAGQRTYYQHLAEIKRGVDTYWMNEPLRFATSHAHTLFAEGGDERMRYGLGFSYNRTMGVMKDSDRDVVNGNVRLIYRYKSLAFTNYFNVDYTYASREKVSFSQFSGANPYYRKLNEYGEPNKVLTTYVNDVFGTEDYLKSVNVYNPLYDMTLNSSDLSRTFGFRNNFEVDWRAVDELRLKGRFSISKSAARSEVFVSPFSTAFADAAETERGRYTENHTDATSYDADFNATYGKLLNGKHMVNAVAGMRFSNQESRTSGFVVRGFIDDRYANPNFATGYKEGEKPNYSNTTKRSASFYFNGGYSYDNRYLLDANFRSDGSSVFGSSKRFASTWAIGIGWNLHHESFFEHVKGIDLLKLRFSVGNPGNQNFDAYMSANIYSYATTYPNPFGLSTVISQWGNQDLEWQKTIDKNFGLDLELLQRRLRLTVDYFIKDTDPLLVFVELPSSTGASSAPTNMGKQQTQGITAILNGVIIKREEMSWQVNLNARRLKYEYKKIGSSLDRYNKENRSSNLTRYYDGGSPSDLWSVRSAGIDPATGREIFIKKDGTQTFLYDYADEVIVGNSDPKVEGVIGTSFYYKGFTASVNLRYRLGGQIFLRTLYEKVENISTIAIQYNQDKRALYDRWQKPGDVAQFKAISRTESTPISSRFVADENTLSGESISFGYESQAAWLRRAGISSLTVRGYMNDIFRISSVKDERGLNYPFARTVSFSLGLRF